MKFGLANAKVVSSPLAPVVNSKDVSLKILAHVQGLRPLFQLTLHVQNTAPSAVLTNLCITFKCDESLYRIYKKLIQVRQVVFYSNNICDATDKRVLIYMTLHNEVQTKDSIHYCYYSNLVVSLHCRLYSLANFAFKNNKIKH